MNVIAGTEVVVAPLALMVCEPPADTGTVKVEVQLPFASAVVDAPTAAPSKVTTIPFSLAAKPLPAIVTEVPIVPFVLLVEMLGLTVKGIAVIEVVVGPEAPTL